MIHKELHKVVRTTRDDLKKDVSTMPFEFTNYPFTGNLRPFQKSAKKTVSSEIRQPDYASHPAGKSASEEADKKTNSTLPVYNAEQIAGIREACRIGRKVLDIAGAAVKVGITCDEIDNIVHEATIAEGAYPSPLNYYNFPKSVCTSVNEVICHGIPDMRPLKDGDIVNVDISVYKNGYHADLNETFLVGDSIMNDADSLRLVECAYNSLKAAIDMCKPGRLYRDIGDAITNVARKAKCSVVTSYCGHGIGELFHTVPTIPHYANNKAKGTMAVGHIFTIEPMINLGTYHDVTWPDGWTSVTADGKRSAQFEHTMLVTEHGVELLTARPGEPTDRMLPWDPLRYKK